MKNNEFINLILQIQFCKKVLITPFSLFFKLDIRLAKNSDKYLVIDLFKKAFNNKLSEKYWSNAIFGIQNYDDKIYDSIKSKTVKHKLI